MKSGDSVNCIRNALLSLRVIWAVGSECRYTNSVRLNETGGRSWLAAPVTRKFLGPLEERQHVAEEYSLGVRLQLVSLSSRRHLS